MKRGMQILFLLTILLGLSNCKKTESDRFYDKKYLEEIRESRKEAVFFLARNFVPGGSIAIAKEGKLIYSEGFGLASNDLEVPVTRDTKFRIGELSEIITSLVYYQLVEKQILHPDSTVQHYLPDFPGKKYKLTLDKLVIHSSGIKEPSGNEASWSGLNVSLENGLEQFKNDSLNFPPGVY